jgi:drug/metabolite transporter (DMT)-like permease
MHSPLILLLVLLSVSLTAAAQIFLKVGVSSAEMQTALGSGLLRNFLLRASHSPWVLLGLTSYALSCVTWLIVLARAELSFAYPFVSLAMIATTLYGFWALQEPIGPERLSGIALIVGGVLLVARS